MADWEMDFANPQENNEPAKTQAQEPDDIDIEIYPPEPEAQQPQPEFTPYPQFTYEPPKKQKSGKVGRFFIWVAVAAIACVISILVTNAVWGVKYDKMLEAFHNRVNVLEQQLENAAVSKPATNPSQEPVTDEMLPAQVYETCVNTVVAIECTHKASGNFGQEGTEYSTGSGVILSQDGYIATNYHVVQDGNSIAVITHGGDEHTAKLVGFDQNNDIAVLKIEGKDLPYATVGSSDDLLVGAKVAAIGNPLGELTATMTVGYISAKDRLVNTDGTSINMLQTDAAINSGNSGGPLFNMYGQVVGITTAKYSGTSNSGASIEGIGFAIPIDDVVDIINDLINYGYVTGAYLGVYVRELDSQVAQMYGLPAGVRVEEVTPGYCAEEAGMKAGDIIIDLGGYKVTCMSDLSRALRKFNGGDETTITVYRSGAEVHLTIKLSEKPQEIPEQQQQPEASMPQNGDYNEWYDYFFGQE